MLRGHVRDAAWISMGIALGRALALVTAIVASHILPVADLAGYLVTVAASLILIPLCDAGCWQLIARSSARAPEAPMFGMTLAAGILRLRLWLLITGVAVVASVASGSFSVVTALCAVAAAIAQVNLDAMSSEQFARQHFQRGALMQVLPAAIGLIGTALLALGTPTMEGAFFVFTLARVLPVLALYLLVRPSPVPAPGLTLKAALPFAGTTLVLVAYTRSDALLLSAFAVSAVALAQYVITYNVVNAMLIIPSSVATALYPRISGGSESRDDKHALALTAFGITTALAGVVGVAAYALPSLALAPFGGGLSRGTTDVAPLFLLIVPVAGSQVLLSAMQGLDHEHTMFRLVLAVGITNVVGHLILIPAFGVPGALIATVGAATVMACVAVRLALQRRPTSREAGPLALLLGSPLAAALGAPSVVAVLGMAIGLAALLAFNTFDVRRRIPAADAVASTGV